MRADTHRKRRWPFILIVASITVGGAIHLPEALAFPHHRRIGETELYADAPPTGVDAVEARVKTLLVRAGVSGQGRQRVFLTDGGWRWRVLALQAPRAFALSRPLGEPIVVNRSDLSSDRVWNGRAAAGVRSLSGVIAHERTHGWMRSRYGPFADLRYPEWLREGFADAMAGDGSVADDAAAAALRAHDPAAPALRYYDGRRRVEAALRANGGNVDALFAANDRWPN